MSDHLNPPSGGNPFDGQQILLATLGTLQSSITRLEDKLDGYVQASASDERVDAIETRVRSLEEVSASRQVLDRLAWAVVGLLAVGNSVTTLATFLLKSH